MVRKYALLNVTPKKGVRSVWDDERLGNGAIEWSRLAYRAILRNVSYARRGSGCSYQLSSRIGACWRLLPWERCSLFLRVPRPALSPQTQAPAHSSPSLQRVPRLARSPKLKAPARPAPSLKIRAPVKTTPRHRRTQRKRHMTPHRDT